MKALGYVRGKNVLFMVLHADEFLCRDKDFYAGFKTEGGYDIYQDLNYCPTDFLVIDSWQRKILNSKDYFGYNSYSILTCEFPSNYKLGEIESIFLKYVENEVHYATGFSLRSVIYKTFNEFQKTFSFAKNRHPDPETTRFIAENNLSTHRCYSPSIWITCFSIFCYKTLYLGSYEGVKTKMFFNKALSVCNSLGKHEKDSSSIRVDIYAREISVYTSYIHCLLGNEDINVCRDLLDEFFNIFDLTNAWRNDFNFSRLLAFHLALNTNPDFEFYLDIAKDLLSHRGHSLCRLTPIALKEFSKTLLCLSNILKVAEARSVSYDDRLSLFKSSTRVNEPVYIDKVKNKLKNV